jgi:hypothetical protein
MWWRRVTILVAVLAVGLGSLADAWVAAADGSGIAAENVTSLRKQVGRQVTVVGRIARTGRSDSGMQFLNFADSELTVVCRREDVSRFRQGEPAELYRGKPVEVTGTVELYRGKLQIRLREPSQIRIHSTSGDKKPPLTTVQPHPRESTLRQIGKDTWLSPAGLRYQGRDPAGLSRLEHICRHVQDEPSRDGPHGVFEGGRDVAFAVIDEAWQLAQTRRLRPVAEGERSSYTVNMGRRIGYLGGRTGAAQGHPALSRVLIVYETGTKNIVTAFPK